MTLLNRRPFLNVIFLLAVLSGCKKTEFALDDETGAGSFLMSSDAKEKVTSGSLPAADTIVKINVPFGTAINVIKRLVGSKPKLPLFVQDKAGLPILDISLDPMTGAIMVAGKIQLPMESLTGLGFSGVRLDSGLRTHEFRLAVRPETRFGMDCHRKYLAQKVCGTFSILDLKILSLIIDDTEVRRGLAATGHLLSLVIANTNISDYIQIPKEKIAGISTKDIMRRAEEYLSAGNIKFTEELYEYTIKGEDNSDLTVREPIPVVSLVLDMVKLVPEIKDWAGNDEEGRYLAENLTFWGFFVSQTKLGAMVTDTVTIGIGVGEPDPKWVDAQMANVELVRDLERASRKSQYAKFDVNSFEIGLDLLTKEAIAEAGVKALLASDADLQAELDQLRSDLVNRAAQVLTTASEISEFSGDPSGTFNRERANAKRRILRLFSDARDRSKRIKQAWEEGRGAPGGTWPLLSVRLSEKGIDDLLGWLKDLKIQGASFFRDLKVKLHPFEGGPGMTVSGLLRVDLKTFLPEVFGGLPGDTIHLNDQLYGDSVPFSATLRFYKSEDAPDPLGNSKIFVEIDRMSLLDGDHQVILDGSSILGSNVAKLGTLIIGSLMPRLSVHFAVQYQAKTIPDFFKALSTRDLTVNSHLMNFQKAISRRKERSGGALDVAELIHVMELDINRAADPTDSVTKLDVTGKKGAGLGMDIFNQQVLNLKAYINQKANGFELITHPADFVSRGFSMFEGLSLWNLQVVADRNEKRGGKIQDTVYGDVVFGTGPVSEVYRKYVVGRRQSVMEARQYGKFREQPNPADMAAVLSLDDINNRLGQIINTTPRSKRPKFSLLGIDFQLSSISIAAIPRYDDKVPDGSGANFAVRPSERRQLLGDGLKLMVSLKKARDGDGDLQGSKRTGDDETEFTITGFAGLRSIPLDQMGDILRKATGLPDEVFLGDQVLGIDFIDTPTLAINPPIFSFSRFINDISQLVGGGKVFDTSPDEFKLPVLKLLTKIIMPIFNGQAANDEGNLQIADIKLNHLFKIIGAEDSIYLLINPRFAGSGVSMTLLSPDGATK